MAAVQSMPGLPTAFKPETEAPKRRDHVGVFHYLRKDISEDELNSGTNLENPNTYGPHNESCSLNVIDVSDNIDKYKLFEHGFEYRKHASKFTEVEDFLNEEKVKAEYWPEVEELVKQVTGSNNVHVFNSMTRESHGRNPQTRPGKAQQHHQAYKTHVDQDFAQARQHIYDHYPKDVADELAKKRFLIVNVWRPMKTIYKSPLAVADLNTMSLQDICRLKINTPDGVKITTLACRSNPKHQWYYKYAQRPDEPLIFLQFDNGKNNVSWGQVPHSAFADEEWEDNEEMYNRRSIESRAIVFYDEEGTWPDQ